SLESHRKVEYTVRGGNWRCKKSPDNKKFLYSAPMTTILVGSEQERFVVHKALLCNKSKYFTKALTGSFEESKTGIVKLDDVSPVLFRIFVTWLYDNVIRYTAPDDSHNLEEDLGSIKSCDTCSQNAPDRDGDVPSTWPYCALIELYLFGDRFDAQQFRVETIDALSYALDKQDNGMSFEEHYYICKYFPVPSSEFHLARPPQSTLPTRNVHHIPPKLRQFSTPSRLSTSTSFPKSLYNTRHPHFSIQRRCGRVVMALVSGSPEMSLLVGNRVGSNPTIFTILFAVRSIVLLYR
ncbi:hypothetical protein D6C88_09277, partial [Aureobasidium pullulans]